MALARSSSVACTPASSIFRHRNARASALTIALSTRGRGAHGAPSGVTICFRPPRAEDGDMRAPRNRLMLSVEADLERLGQVRGH